VENTHSPIVDIETWDKVQILNQTARKAVENHQEPQQSLFSGLLICPDCNSKMGYAKRTETKKDGRVVNFGSYVCRTYMRSGCVACSSHRINERSLKELVLANIREATSKVTCDEGAMQKSLYNIKRLNAKAQKAKMAQEQRQLEQQIYDLDNRITTLYEEKAEELILPEDFYCLIKEIEAQRKAAEKRLIPLLKAICKAKINTAEEEKWTSLIKEKSSLGEVDRDTMESLIDRIEIGAREGTNSHPTQEVKIYYRFENVRKNFQ
jgi:hypothetical protein